MGIKKELGRATKEVLTEGAQLLGKQIFGPNSAQMSLGHRLFGKEIPQQVVPILKKPTSSYSSGIDDATAFTLNKAIDLDPEVREPVETLFRMMGDGDDNAYETMARMVEGFEMEDTFLRQKMAAQKKMSGVNKVYDDAQNQKKIWHQQEQLIEDASTATRSRGRQGKEFISTADKTDVVSHHQKAMTYQPDVDGSGKTVGGYQTEGHHVNILDEYAKIPMQHSSAAGITPNSPSPIVQVLEKIWGVKAGNAQQNIADVLANMTRGSREARVKGLSEQTQGLLHESTLDDILGKSKYKPREFSGEQAVALNQFKKNNPGKSTEDFISRWTQETGEKIPEGSFPDIRVYAPDAVSGGKKKVPPLEIIKVKDQATHSKRVELVFDALERHRVPGVDEARKAYSLKDAKVDSKLDIYGSDHEVTHDILRDLKKIEGTAQYEIEQLGPDGIFNLSFEDAVRLQIRNVQEMETVLAHVLQYRYKQIQQLFKELNPKKSFETDLSAGEKQTFFRANINKIAVMGNVGKEININNALKPVKNWNNHVGDVFGWSPQSLWMTIKQMEEIIKEVGETVPTTQPIPGVE